MEEGLIDFFQFRTLCRELNFDEAKRLVTPSNILSRDAQNSGIVYNVCLYLDDPDFLRYVLQLGAPLEVEESPQHYLPIHHVASANKSRMLRVLLDFGTPVDARGGCYNHTALHIALIVDRRVTHQRETSKMLLDAGAKLAFCFKENVPDWAHAFVANREQTRCGCIIVMGLRISRSNTLGHSSIVNKDVLRIVARCLWSTRGFTTTQ